MNVQQFQQIAENLLQKHYGLSLNDTRLCEPAYVAVLIDGKARPFEYINEHATDCGLDRVDLERFGVSSNVALTEKDEAKAVASLAGMLSHDSMSCQNNLNDHEKAAELNDRYADSIIGDRADVYDALEIQGVRDAHEANDPAGTCCEVDNENPQFFSVYAHIKAGGECGGVECVGDFSTHSMAEDYAKELSAKYCWPIHDFVNQRFKRPMAA